VSRVQNILEQNTNNLFKQHLIRCSPFAHRPR